MQDEQNFVHETEELISFPKLKSPIRLLFERRVVLGSRRLFGPLFRKEVRHMSAHDKEVAYYYDDGLLDRFTVFTMLVAVLVMLIAPLWILQALREVHHKLGIITAFTVMWLGILSYGTNGKVFEKLAAVAG